MSADARGLRVIRLDATLARDEGGQISLLGVLAAAAFACLLLLVVNTGYATSGKIEMQNAADATAISGATWIARALNVISLNNVTSTQILAIIVIVRALNVAIPEALALLVPQLAACAIPVVGAALCVIINLQIDVLTGIQTGVAWAQSLVVDGGLLWQVLNALELVSLAVSKSFGLFGLAEGDRVARQNGAELGLLLSQNVLPSVPVRRGNMRPDFCEPTRSGPLKSYSDTLNLIFIPLVNSGIHFFFLVSKNAQFFALCGGSTGEEPDSRPVDSLRACQLAGGGTAYWAKLDYESKWLPTRQSPFSPTDENDNRLAGKPRAERIAQSCYWIPPDRDEREYKRNVGTDDAPINQYRYEVTDYRFLSATVPTNVPKRPPERLPTGGSTSGQPAPYILVDNAEEELRYLAIVYRRDRSTVAPDYFYPAYGTHRLAYGQARVYNPTAFDTFTQNWRVTLEPASLLETSDVGGSLSSPAAGFTRIKNLAALAAFRNAFPVFNRGSLNVLRNVNNH